MDRSIHKEMQLIVDPGGNEDASDFSCACYINPNRRRGTAVIFSNSCVSSLIAADKNPSLLLS